MATTSASAGNSTPNIAGALGAGSGIDIRTLAQNLVDIEKKPRQDVINKRISKEEGRISGLAAMKFAVSDLQSKLGSLKNAKAFGATTSVSSLSAAVTIQKSSPEAVPGSYSVQVNTLAQGQRTLGSFASADAVIDTDSTYASPITVTFSGKFGGSSTRDIVVTLPVLVDSATQQKRPHTVQYLVDAINNNTSLRAVGIKAQLFTGTAAGDVKLVLAGHSGEANQFSVVTTLNNGEPSQAASNPFVHTDQVARDANVTVNGVAIKRSSNTISDAIPGVTLGLVADAQTSGGTAPTSIVTVARDTSAVSDAINNLVNAYNDFADTLDILGDAKSTVDKYGGALAGDSLLRNIRSTVYQALTAQSPSATDSIRNLADIGVSVDRTGKLFLDPKKLDGALTSNYGDIVTMMTGDLENASAYGVLGGVAGRANKAFEELVRTTGVFTRQTSGPNGSIEKIARYKKDLSKLDDQMQMLLERYMKQFTVMDNLVSAGSATRSNLKTTFENMNPSRR